MPEWLPFRARHGRVFFLLKGTDVRVWQLPAIDAEDLASGRVKVLGDGDRAVNDPESWDCVRDERTGEQYFCNRLSGEKTWHVPPGCHGKLPINAPESWLTFACEARGGQRFYLNKMTGERTWHRPRELGEAREDEPGFDLSPENAGGDDDNDDDDDDGRFLSDGGDEFVIPEEDLELAATAQAPELAPAAELGPPVPPPPPVASEPQDPAARENAEAAEQEARLRRLREAFEAEDKAKLRERFEQLLDERGVLPHSRWENWHARLQGDPRMSATPVEDRARWFASFALKLIGQEQSARRRRMVRLKHALLELAQEPGGARLVSDAVRPDELLAALKAAGRADAADSNSAEEAKGQEQAYSVDAPLARKVRTAIRAVTAQDASKVIAHVARRLATQEEQGGGTAC